MSKEKDDLQLWLRRGRLGHPYQSEVDRARRLDAEDIELRSMSAACVCSAHQQPRCAHWRNESIRVNGTIKPYDGKDRYR